MKRNLLFFATFLFSVISISGQTAADFEKKYSSEIYYEIRPTVLMSADFDENGQVCSVSLQPNRISRSANTVYLGIDTLDSEILKAIFDELVPPETREGKFESMGFFMTGSMGFSAVSWENVRFNVKYSMTRRNKRPIDMSQKGKEGLDLLFSLTPIQPDIASITWTKRKCAE